MPVLIPFEQHRHYSARLWFLTWSENIFPSWSLLQFLMFNFFGLAISNVQFFLSLLLIWLFSHLLVVGWSSLYYSVLLNMVVGLSLSLSLPPPSLPFLSLLWMFSMIVAHSLAVTLSYVGYFSLAFLLSIVPLSYSSLYCDNLWSMNSNTETDASTLLL